MLGDTQTWTGQVFEQLTVIGTMSNRGLDSLGPFSPNGSAPFCSCSCPGSLHFPVWVYRDRSNFCLLVMEYWILILWATARSSRCWRKALWHCLPEPEGQLYCRQPLQLREEIPTLFWFGLGPRLTPHKAFKELLEYLSKRSFSIVFICCRNFILLVIVKQDISGGLGLLLFSFVRSKAVN